MPPLLILLAGAAVAFITAKANSRPAAPASPASPFGLDRGLEPRLRAQIERALAQELDPRRLEVLADQYAVYYPYAARALRDRAASLRRLGYGAPSRNPPLPAPAPPAASDALPVSRGDGLDATLPLSVRANVIELLSTAADPTGIEAFASHLTEYPLAQAALRLRAAFLRGRGRAGAAPTSDGTAAGPQGLGTDGLDQGMPDNVRFNVVELLSAGTDPAMLEGFAATLGAYPLAQAALRTRAATLRALAGGPQGAQAPSAPSSTSTAAPSPVPTTAWPSAPASPVPPFAPPTVTPPIVAPSVIAPPTPSLPPLVLPSVLDEGMTQEDQARLMNVLTAENDPIKLRALADTLGPHYPKAALLLTNKAEAIQVLLIRSNSAPSIVPAVAWVPSTPPSLPPYTRVRKYVVKEGDFPIKIATKFGQPTKAWKELVAANPHKELKPDGNFKLLLPGEELFLPASWPALPGLTTTPKPSAPAPGGPTLAPSNGDFDPNLPVAIAETVTSALARQGDSAKLRELASALMGTYPIAAGALLAKANAAALPTLLAAAVPVAPPGAVPTMNPSVVPVVLRAPAPPAPSAPPSKEGTYRVVSGDSVSKIAKRLVHDDRRWPELVKANPTKKRNAQGYFEVLKIGEVLQLPASWVAPLPSLAKDAPTVRA